MPRTLWHYFRAGNVERGARYTLREGFARVTATGVEYPWLTRREAQREAKEAGARAVFHYTAAEARTAAGLAPERYTLAAGRCIERDGVAVATLHGVRANTADGYAIGGPCEMDAFARDVVAALNAAEDRR